MRRFSGPRQQAANPASGLSAQARVGAAEGVRTRWIWTPEQVDGRVMAANDLDDETDLGVVRGSRTRCR